MTKIDYLTFKIVNELLNRGYIIDDIQPSVYLIEAAVSTVLRTYLGEDITGERKIHFECFGDELLCHQRHVREPRLTTDEAKVTCRRCLQSLAGGRRDWCVSVGGKKYKVMRSCLLSHTWKGKEKE